MSTIEKLFVQIFDRKRQIVEQLNHQKQLYDQNLVSKLLIQGITPPPWLLNSDKFASSSASTSDPKGLNKEELISGLLLPCPQPLPFYSNATHLYGKPLSTVGDGELQHELFNDTSTGHKGLDDCRPGVLPQCLFRGLEDVHNHVTESSQERVASDTYAGLDQSLARVQRSESRQKATHLCGKPLSTGGDGELQHELFNATSTGHKGLDDCRPGVLPQCLFRGLEDVHNHVTESPQERVASDTYADLDQSLARVQRSKSRQKACELRSSRKKSVKSQLEENPSTGPRKQDVLKEGSEFIAHGVLSSSKVESLPKKLDLFSKEERELRCTLNETSGGVLSSPKDESLTKRQDISSMEKGAYTCSALETTGAGLSSSKYVSLPEKQDISSKEGGDFRCTTNETEAPTNCLSPHSNSRDLSVEYSLAAADSVSSREGMSRHLSKEPVVGINGSFGRKRANSNLLTEELIESQGCSKEDDISLCHTKQLDASSNVESPEDHLSQLEIEQPDSLSSERVIHATSISGMQEVLEKSPAEGALVDIANSNMLTEGCLEECQGLSKEDEFSGATANEQPTSSSEDDMKHALVMQRQEMDDPQTQDEELTEWPGTTENELGTSNSEDDVKNASVRQIRKLGDTEPQAAEQQAICFSKEKFSISPKLLKLHTPNSASGVGCSWPQQKRRKIESAISKSASPHLRLNPSIFSDEVDVTKSCTGDLSATEAQNSIITLSNLLEHSSITEHKEEKHSCQGSHDVEAEKMQVSSISCLTQQFSSTPQECFREVDLTRKKCDLSFSISNVDADNTDNICHWENSLESKKTYQEGVEPDLECFVFEKKWNYAQIIGENDVNMDDKVDDSVADIMNGSPTARCQQKSPQIVKDFDSFMEHMNTACRKTVVADLQNFTFCSKSDDTHHTGDLERSIAIDLPKNTIDRAEFLERLCRSASLGVPLSRFHASCSSESKVDACHSVPVGILEETDLRNTSAINDETCQLLNASHTFTKNVENSEFESNSFSHYSPTPSTPFAWDFKGPCMSPFGKSTDGVTTKSRSSSKRGSSNPEHICFPIEEASEEDADADDNDYNDPEETGASEEYMNTVAFDPSSNMVDAGCVSTETSSSTSDKRRCSSPEFSCSPIEERTEQLVNETAAQRCMEESGSARQPLCDISENTTAQAVHPSSRRGTESFSMASSTGIINRKISQNSQARTLQSGRLRKRKETHNSSLDATGKKHFEARQTRFSKAKVLVKSGMETRGGSFSVKEPKPNNIVSSLKSFLPLVQQKQAAACAPVKKEVRVKALEAAQAAKRVAEKTENERLQRKEAMKQKRAREEQEKLRQLELQTKERKKKDAEIAERKRQREEEEDRKEKERKRKRVGEARKQKKGHEDKVPVDKEDYKSHAQYGKTDNQATSSALPITSGDLKTNELRLSSDPCQKQKVSVSVAGCSTPVPYLSATQTVIEKSYDISPYCCSDDEGDEDDELHNNKFIPAWASKSSMKAALTSFNTSDPDVIFPPSSFCSLNEVLLPRELKQR